MRGDSESVCRQRLEQRVLIRGSGGKRVWKAWPYHFSTDLPQWDQTVVFIAPDCLVGGLAVGSAAWRYFLNVVICTEPVTSSAGGKNYLTVSLALTHPKHAREPACQTGWALGSASP